VLDASRTHQIPICAHQRVLFAQPQDKPVFDVLHCIREGFTLDEAGRSLLPNAEAHLKSVEAMDRQFSRHPGWLARSRTIADACRFSLKELRYRFPYEISDISGIDLATSDDTATATATATSTPTPSPDPNSVLRALTYRGASSRYDGCIPPSVRDQ